MFRIGTIIEATKEASGRYNITNRENNFLGRVIANDGSKTKVRIVKCKRGVGQEYWVYSKYFIEAKNNINTLEKLKESV